MAGRKWRPKKKGTRRLTLRPPRRNPHLHDRHLDDDLGAAEEYEEFEEDDDRNVTGDATDNAADATGP